MKLFIYLRSLFGPRPVSEIIADTTALVEELKRTAEVQDRRSDTYAKLSHDAYSEARRATRIAGKISELVS